MHIDIGGDMEKYGLNELRSMFLDFFESKGHLKLDSFSLIPHNDKSLLLINSGMAPLKPYFTGQETPPEKRVTTCQKCIRTPDIDNVGKTARHGTFFEMLGNFSFGDYFKKEAIAWAWEFLTEVVRIDKNRLYVSVYEEDDEAVRIWKKTAGLTDDKIFRMGKEDNFWEIGTGPCGPCSEIYVDRGEKYGCGKAGCTVGCDCDRYVEVWNLVFTQFNKDENGNYSSLEHPNIDTGMGLERLATVMQDVDNIFEVDTIRYILDHVCKLSGYKYGTDSAKDVSVRVVTDHIRSVVFMLSDGVIPSNEGRGYVLRRLLRRAVRHGKLLGIEDNFMAEMTQKVVDTSGKAYGGLIENLDCIIKTVQVEEAHFNETISLGMELIKAKTDAVKQQNGTMISGEDAFRLYDTYGFPLELTTEIAGDEGLSVDIDGFNAAMKNQRLNSAEARSKMAVEGWKDELTEIVAGIAPTVFTGYEKLWDESEVILIVKDGISVEKVTAGDKCILLTSKTPFYAQSGGQTGDIGYIGNDSMNAKVKDTLKSGDKFAHYAEVLQGNIETGDKVILEVNGANRLDTERNHSATHLLHKALKNVLGVNVNQAGSEVSPEKLRFDFTHYEKLMDEQLDATEKIVNAKIYDGLDIVWFESEIGEAKKLGATALFGEKYGKTVRVVKMGDYSMEFCGGCHLKNTAYMGMFIITSESSVAAGVRRIEALTGRKAYEYVKNMRGNINEAAHALKTKPEAMLARIGDLHAANDKLSKELHALKSACAKDTVSGLLSKACDLNGCKCIAARVDGLTADEMRNLCDSLKDKLKSAVVLLVSTDNNKGMIVASATKDAVAVGFDCGAYVRKVASSVGGGGGGKPDMAQAGLKDVSRADEAVENAAAILKEML